MSDTLDEINKKYPLMSVAVPPPSSSSGPASGDPSIDNKYPLTPAQTPQSAPKEQGSGINDGIPMEPHSFSRLGREAIQPIIGVNQLAAHALGVVLPQSVSSPLIKDADEWARANQESIDRSRGGATGTNWEQVAVDIANPIYWGPGRVAEALGLGSRFVAPMLGGGVAALDQPITDNKTESDYWKSKRNDALVGTAVGAIPGVGAKAFSITDDARILMRDHGIPLSIGQAKGGVVRELEQRGLTGIPIAGRLVVHANDETLREFNRAAYDEVLRPYGMSYPKNGPIGREGIEKLHDLVSNNYAQAVNGASFTPNFPGFYNRVQSKLGSLWSEMDDQGRAQFLRIIDNRFASTIRSSNGTISGDVYKTIESDILKASDTQAREGKAQLSDALKHFNDVFRQELEIQNPGIAAELQKADQAYYAYRRVGEASTARINGDGIFSPGDYLNAIKRRSNLVGREKAFEDGLAPLQEFAERAYRVIPNKFPDSGTAGRGQSSRFIERTVGGLAAGGTMIDPVDAVKVATIGGLAALPYTRPWMRVARTLSASTNPLKDYFANLITKAAPGVAGATTDDTRVSRLPDITVRAPNQ